MAHGNQVLGGSAGPALVIDVHGWLIWQGRRVHHDQRHTGGTDLLHLGMTRRQTNRNNAIDGCMIHRPRQGTAQRRDEVECVSLSLGRQGHALKEGTEERVGEDDRERLRRQHADRHGPSLREHAGHGVRTVAEGHSNIPDPAGRFRRQTIRTVERERHRSLRHAGFPGDVGDARSARGPLLHGLLAGPAAAACRFRAGVPVFASSELVAAGCP